MKMKLILVLVMWAALPAWATSFTNTPDAVIPDNNPNGFVDAISVSSLGPQLQDVSVQLNFSGGFNGDLFAYLTYDGQTATLFNRVGTGGGNTFGYSNPGFDVTLTDSGIAGLHNYQVNGGTYNGNGQLTGIWQP